MLVYIDANCFNRPFDDQKQARVQRETEAVFRVLERIERGLDQLSWSPALTFELSAHPEAEIRAQLLTWSKHAAVNMSALETARQRAEALVQHGLKALDAAHIAFAEAAGCGVLLTCDDRMRQRSRKLNLLLRVLNPVDMWRRSIMAGALTDEQVRQTGLAALEGKLGPVDALRFVALLRREPFDYQAWRDKSFDGLSVGELFQRFEQAGSEQS